MDVRVRACVLAVDERDQVDPLECHWLTGAETDQVGRRSGAD